MFVTVRRRHSHFQLGQKVPAVEQAGQRVVYGHEVDLGIGVAPFFLHVQDPQDQEYAQGQRKNSDPQRNVQNGPLVVYDGFRRLDGKLHLFVQEAFGEGDQADPNLPRSLCCFRNRLCLPVCDLFQQLERTVFIDGLLLADPGETNDQSRENPSVVDELTAQMDGCREDLGDEATGIEGRNVRSIR